MRVGGALFWVSGGEWIILLGGWGEWENILGGWEWVGLSGG